MPDKDINSDACRAQDSNESDDCGEAFQQDMILVRDQFEKNDNSMIVSYGVYVGIKDLDTGEISHVSSFATNQSDALIGRLEMLKAIIVQHYNTTVLPETRTSPQAFMGLSDPSEDMKPSKPSDDIKGKSFNIEAFMAKIAKNKLN